MLIYNFAFIVTDGEDFIDRNGKLTKDKRRAERYPYHCEATRVAAARGPSFKVREIE